MSRGASYHAIYLVLNEEQLFEASLRSVYPHITGATVVTSHDHDRFDRPVSPDGTVTRLLSRELDPERKVNVIVCAEGDEVALRNRAMAFAMPPSRSHARHGLQPSRPRVPPPDWFWIVDADEIYDDTDVQRLKEHVETHRARVYLVTADNYWRSWNWRIEQLGSYVAVVAPGVWFGELRHQQVRTWERVLRRLTTWRIVPEATAQRWRRISEVPREVAIFHHGSYLGDRARIEAKLASSGHRDQHLADWLDRVWDGWTPDDRDLHPFDPPAFPVAEHVPTASLPAAIREARWPEGWLEPA